METLLTLLLNLMLINAQPGLNINISSPSDCYNPRQGPMMYDVEVMGANGGGHAGCVPFEAIPRVIVDMLGLGTARGLRR